MTAAFAGRVALVTGASGGIGTRLAERLASDGASVALHYAHRAEAVEELAQHHPERRELIEAYWLRWHETLGDAIQPTVAVLDELRGTGLRLFALTNWSGETFPVARPRFPFLEWFEGIVVSGDERLIKPDPDIFHLLIERYGVDPETTVFIDDAADNVAAAHALGFRAIRFVDALTLRADLRRLGVLVGA